MKSMYIVAILVVFLLISSSVGYYMYSGNTSDTTNISVSVDTTDVSPEPEPEVKPDTPGVNTQGGGSLNQSSSTGGSGSLNVISPIPEKKPIIVPEPTAWRCVPGVKAPLRKNANGDVECASIDGKNCLQSKPCDQQLKTLPNNLNPLACGEMHKKQWGGTGYDKPGHWCNKYV